MFVGVRFRHSVVLFSDFLFDCYSLHLFIYFLSLLIVWVRHPSPSHRVPFASPIFSNFSPNIYDCLLFLCSLLSMIFTYFVWKIFAFTRNKRNAKNFLHLVSIYRLPRGKNWNEIFFLHIHSVPFKVCENCWLTSIPVFIVAREWCGIYPVHFR